MKKSALLLGLACCALFFQGCGGAPPPPVATHFSVTSSPANATAGTAVSLTVSAVDNSGQVITTYAGTVFFTSSDAQATLPAGGPLTNGTASFSITFKTAGSQTVTASDSAISGISGAISVSAGAPAKLSVTSNTAGPVAGASFNITVSAQDAFGNTASSYSGKVQFASTDKQASLPGSGSLANGTGTFSVTLKTAGSQTITVTDAANALAAGISSSISVSPGPASQLSVTAPSAATVGLVTTITVRALDAYANVATSYTGAVQLTSSDAQAVIQPVSQALSNGSGAFSVTFKVLNNQTTVTATDTANATLTAKSASINVVTNAATHFSLATPATAATRATFSLTVTALDAANNISTVYSGTVHFSSTDTQAFLPTDAPLSSGAFKFSATFETAGSQTINATDTVSASINGSSAINVTAAQALTISSNAPPNGTFGAVYGQFITVMRNFLCTRNSTGVVTCTLCFFRCGGPPCNSGFTNTPCVQSRPVKVFHGFSFSAKGGVGAYTWSATSMPPGLTVDAPSGGIVGTPTSPGTYQITVTVTDSGKPAAQTSANFSITITLPPPPVVNTTPPPFQGVLNQPYSFTFTATGAAPLTWSESGALPNGLTFNTTTGTLFGTPTAVSSFPIQVTATDQFNQSSAPAAFTIVINQHGFIPTGSMATARRFHTATLLPSGKVLIAGGEDAGSTAFASAELFDPATGTFSATGNMTVPRVGHTATLLNTGKVLITGGASTSSEAAVASAELYDPGTGTFTATNGPMNSARVSHTATLLQDGKVLVAGGDVIFYNGISNPSIQSLASAELFDPGTGLFTFTGSMATARESHTATLLNSGLVLVAGGSDGAVGNTPAATVLASAELFDPSKLTFSSAGIMDVPRDFHTATLLNTGKVLIAGGVSISGFLNTAVLFDPTSLSFSSTGSMADVRFYHDATLLQSGTVLVSGGTDANSRAIATAEVYDPNAATFSSTGSMIAPRVWHTSTLLQDGRVLVTGGAGPDSIPIATAELYQ